MIDRLDDADLDDDAPSEGPGKPGEYVHYLKAKAILAERLGATAHEIAMWTWLGKELHGKAAGGLNGYLNPADHDGPPPRFHFEEPDSDDFAYLPQLVNCYFLAGDLRDFEPQDRYLTFDRVLERFSRFWSQQEAEATIRAKAQSGELESYHPRTGGTAETKAWGEEEGFPPLEEGLFVLGEVCAVEEECGQTVVAVERLSGFTALSQLLEGCWDLPLAELSKAQRERVRSAYRLHWDTLTHEQRRVVAAQLDSQRDPAMEKDWDEAVVGWGYWRHLPALEAIEFIALRHLHDPRELESKREVFPGGKPPSLGRRVDDDLRRINRDPTVAGKQLPLRKWVEWAKKAGLECPVFMHAQLAAEAAAAIARSKEGITPKNFTEKHARYIRGGADYLDKWFNGKRRSKGERPGAAAFRISRGYYDEAGMVAALKEAGVYSEIRGAERQR